MRKVILSKLNIAIQYEDKDFEDAATINLETSDGKSEKHIITYLQEDDVYILVPKNRYKETEQGTEAK